jgi:hypothetical protein
MPRGKGIYDDENTDERTGDRASDQSQETDTTKQENTPDVAETDEEPTA